MSHSVYYRHQTSVPIVGTIACDDAGPFKLLTDKLALCCPVSWKADAGRHYEKLSPVAPRHKQRLDSFLDRYWDYYRSLQNYRDGPTDELAEWHQRLRLLPRPNPPPIRPALPRPSNPKRRC